MANRESNLFCYLGMKVIVFRLGIAFSLIERYVVVNVSSLFSHDS